MRTQGIDAQTKFFDEQVFRHDVYIMTVRIWMIRIANTNVWVSVASEVIG